MADEQVLVTVRYRGLPLMQDAVLSDKEGRTAFVDTPHPMPVGTPLEVRAAQAQGPSLLAQVISTAEAVKAQAGDPEAVSGLLLAFVTDHGSVREALTTPPVEEAPPALAPPPEQPEEAASPLEEADASIQMDAEMGEPDDPPIMTGDFAPMTPAAEAEEAAADGGSDAAAAEAEEAAAEPSSDAAAAEAEEESEAEGDGGRKKKKKKKKKQK